MFLDISLGFRHGNSHQNRVIIDSLLHQPDGPSRILVLIAVRQREQDEFV